MEEKTKSNKKRIIIVAVIAIIITGIFIYKNLDVFSLSDEEVSSEGENSEQTDTIWSLYATETFNLEKTLSQGVPVIIVAGSESCYYCQEMKPVLQALNEDLEGEIVIKYLDVDLDYENEMELPLRAYPTLFFFNADGSPYIPDENISVYLNHYVNESTEEIVYTIHEGYLSEEELMIIFEDMGV
jgi:thioredoxin 1